MKRIFTAIFCIFIGMVSFAQTQLYEHPNFDELTKDHKIIGILPFKATVKLRPNQMRQMTPEQLTKMEIAEGENIQLALFSWFMRRQERGSLSVKVQDPKTTMALLIQGGVTNENIAGYTSAQIAKIIGVDALISGSFETTKPMSEGASVALGLLVGFWGSTNKAVINLFIYNGIDGEMLVNYNKAVSGSIGSSSDDLINMLMRKASRRISYTKNS